MFQLDHQHLNLDTLREDSDPSLTCAPSTCTLMFSHTLSADLVGAPAGEVDPPVVQLQLCVSGRVGTVEAHKTTLGVKNDRIINILSMKYLILNLLPH